MTKDKVSRIYKALVRLNRSLIGAALFLIVRLGIKLRVQWIDGLGTRTCSFQVPFRK